MRGKVRKIAIGCAGGVLVLLLLEGALRLFWPEMFPRLPRGLYVPHPQLGHVLAPNRADQAGASFLDLTAMLTRPGDGPGLYLTWIGTWRPPTYRLAAEAIAQKILALGWLDETDRK